MWRVSRRGTAFLIVIGAALALGGARHAWDTSNPDTLVAISTTTVRRGEYVPSVVVRGEVRGLKRTTISLEVENLKGGEALGGGYLAQQRGPAPATTILSIVPDGSLVQEGQVLCKLDSAWFEEQQRLQAIEVELATAENSRAELALGVARAELLGFKEGEMIRQGRENRTSVALSQAKFARARDRLDWTQRMLGLGYLGISDLGQEELETTRAEVELDRAEILDDVYQRYSAPRIQRYWEAEVEKAEADAEFARLQLEQERTRLDLLRKQIERCTIKAPHAGRVIYADLFIRQWYQIREGAEVFSGQELFYLPDTNQMGVEVEIPESAIARVEVGQEARVSIGAFPGETFKARVKELATLPEQDWKSFDDIQIFYGTLEILDARGRLLPEMTARVEILTEPARSRLTIPVQAVLVDEGQSYCLRVQDKALERRAVLIAPLSTDLVEVLSGLEDGDEIALDPWRLAPTDD